MNMHTLNRRAWLAALCCAAPLAACDAPVEGPPAFADVDTNANGMISVVEAQQNDTVMRDFDKTDNNKDGSLDKIEYGKLASNEGVMEQQSSLKETETY